MATGYAAGAAWLRGIAKLDEPPTGVVETLERLEALPVGWRAGMDGSVSLRPIVITLECPVRIRPWEREPKPVPGQPMLPKEPWPEPVGAWAPDHPCRATLSEIEGRLTWVSEIFSPYEKTWSETLREPLEP